MKSVIFVLACLGISAFGTLLNADEKPATVATAGVPAGWLPDWKQPPASCRPLQIVHGLDPRRAMPEGIEQMLNAKEPSRLPVDGMRYYLERGLGGVVCNVAFQDYLRSEANWKALLAGIQQCEQLGLVVWLYDEHGYPSGAAGGLVLAENRQYEAQELAFDVSLADPLILRPAYEYTHASNNYHAARRYVNLLDDRATQCFIAKTHEAYAQRLEPFFGRTIQAMFTDEPSLIAVNLGQIPEPARSRVPVVDPLDPAVRLLPCVPWCYDLPARYQQRYGEDLLPQRRSLFAGDAPEDRQVRRQFWQLIADLVADRYFGALQRWCGDHRIVSSGHSLWEEALLHHVALEGNGLKVLTKLDVPGLDVLTSDPEAVLHSGWLTAGLPASAAVLNGGRRVMTEVSDFSQKMGGAGPAGLPEMQATAAWQAAWGVTEFTLYYGLGDRSAEIYRAYGDYVGRLNAVLRAAQPTPQVLLYYPIYDLWAEYLPTAEPLRLESQSPRARRIVSSFLRLGQTLQRHQIPFTLIDHEFLAGGKVAPDGVLEIHGRRYQTIVVPEGCELPAAAGKVADALRAAGGAVLLDTPEQRGSLLERVPTRHRLEPPSERIALGRFSRDGQEILLLANVGRDDYRGHLGGDPAGRWQTLDPATAEVHSCQPDAAGRLPIALAGRQSLLLVRTE